MDSLRSHKCAKDFRFCGLSGGLRFATQNFFLLVDAAGEREERIAEAIEIRTPLLRAFLPFLI